MKPEKVRAALLKSIQFITEYKDGFSVRSGRDNTRNRKLPFTTMISSVLAFRGGTV